MNYVIDREELLNRLNGSDSFIEVIPASFNYHSVINESAVGLYYRGKDDEHGYIVPFNHYDANEMDLAKVEELLMPYQSWCFDKKELLKYIHLPYLKDANLFNSLVDYDRLEKPMYNSGIDYYYKRHGDNPSINRLVPIVKLLEYYDSMFEIVKPTMDREVPEWFDFYNSISVDVFNQIEQPGVGIQYDKFVDNFKPNNPVLSIKDNIAYTKYNLNNVTSRPTNAFNSVNFAAIPKSERHRQSFRPINDYFIEFDFDGYHLRLLCDQIKYGLTDESAHKQLARLYYAKDDITEEEYNQAKQINFHALYGKIPEELQHLEFFVKVRKYIDDLWNEFQTKGFIVDPISKRKITNKLEEMHPAKLMNYLMQSLETSRNILILNKVLNYLSDKKSWLGLYIYDALVFDFNKLDGKQTLNQLEAILSEKGKYPVKFKYGKDLGFD